MQEKYGTFSRNIQPTTGDCKSRHKNSSRRHQKGTLIIGNWYVLTYREAYRIEFQDIWNGNDDTYNIKPLIDVQNIAENQEYGIND